MIEIPPINIYLQLGMVKSMWILCKLYMCVCVSIIYYIILHNITYIYMYIYIALLTFFPRKIGTFN